MTEVLHSPCHHFCSSPRTTTSSHSSPSSLSCAPPPTDDPVVEDYGCGGGAPVTDCDTRRREQLSLLALLVTYFRKSLTPCKRERRELCAMEIGWPTNVRHVAHVTFDRFNGFLGLPVEFEPEVPRRPPSAR